MTTKRPALQQGCPFCRPDIDQGNMGKVARPEIARYKCMECGGEWRQETRKWEKAEAK